MQKANQPQGNRYFIYFIAAIAALGGLLFGYDTGVISGAILYIQRDFVLSHTAEGFVIGAVLLGALLGALIAGRVSDYYGRKRVIIVTSFIFILGSLVTAFSPNIDTIVVGRFVLGIAIGIASFAAPLYIAEVAPYRYRGGLVSLNQLAITVGIVLSYLVDYGFANTPGDWRWMLGAGVVPALVLLIGMLFLPASPRWMVLKGWVNQARDVLNAIRYDQNVEEELSEIQRTVAEKHHHKTDWHALFQPWLRPALLVGFSLAFFQQMTGINTIIYYAPTIFNQAGFGSNQNSILATFIVGIINVLATIVAIVIVDRVGRRPLLLIGLVGMGASLLCLGVAFYVGAHSLILKWIALASMIVYIISFASSLGIMLWIILSEIYPLAIRGLGMSLATAATWGFNFIVTFTFLLLVDWLSMAGAFWFYAIICFIGLAYVYRYVPETKGVTLEYIEANLRLGKPSRELGVPVKN